MARFGGLSRHRAFRALRATLPKPSCRRSPPPMSRRISSHHGRSRQSLCSSAGTAL